MFDRVTLAGLYESQHELHAYCPRCERWRVLLLADMIADGQGPRSQVTGSLKVFDGARDLHRIKGPVLFVTGQYNEARPETAAAFQQLTPRSQFVVIADAARM